ncbi:MAG: polyphenol oxidase family protein, partial [Candidatus Binatia bacterium]
MDLLQLEAPGWRERDGLLHGFFGRRGGESTGPFSGLNISFDVGDDPRAVTNNICNMKRALGVHDLRIVTMKQVHGDHIIDVKDGSRKEAGEGDGMVTTAKGVFLGVLTADCVPILLCAPTAKLVAVAHAGWRGTLLGVAPKMINHLRNNYGIEAAAIEVALGPAIGSCCYEIGSDVSKPIIKKWGSLGREALRTESGKGFLDLKLLNISLFKDAGIFEENISQLGSCT